MNWTVEIAKKVLRKLNKVPEKVQLALLALTQELEKRGPVQGKWPNYSKLKGRQNQHHCHLVKGKNTYVAVWEVDDKKIKFIEVIYVGTHEKAPY
jgi:mRNA-degrading endonuclease RelE of RelBE toxin-antitoxin system